MFATLDPPEYHVLQPLLRDAPCDPMLYMLLEGNRPGRVFVDQPHRPTMALAWTGMEYAYLLGNPAGNVAALVQVVDETMMPALELDGLDFVTIFPGRIPPADVQGWFPHRQPVSFGVNTFAFDSARFAQRMAQAPPLPAGYELVRLEPENLAQEACHGICEDILFCWGSMDRFAALGLGYCLLHAPTGVVSACYAIGVGAEAYHINVWTHPEHRRRGLAHQVTLAFLAESSPKGRPIYWINDAPNIASRRLAESTGFVYTGDLATVDIPVHPYQFHLGLAAHFADYLHLYAPAGELVDMAFSLREGDAAAYQRAATIWEQAGNPAQAAHYAKLAASLA